MLVTRQERRGIEIRIEFSDIGPQPIKAFPNMTETSSRLRMNSKDHERELAEKAVQGDENSLQKLLVPQTDVVARFAASRLPQAVREQVDPEDIVQQTFVKAFRSIGQFRPEEATSFQAWLLAIADHVIKDTIKGQQRIKRGGQFQRLRQAEPTPS